MKFIFIADLHLSGYSQDKIVENLPERLNSIKNVLYEIADYAINNNIFTIVIGGDILHGKSIIHALAQSVMLEYFRNYNGKLQFVIIDGNHDLSGKGNDAISALLSLDNEPNVKRIINPEVLWDKVLFVPYSFNMVDYIKENKCKYLVSHFGLDEGMLNNGLSIVADISITDLVGKYEYVLLGHYHKPQEIIRDDISLYYSGSLIQLDWGEKNEDKRFLVVDLETDNIESVNINNYVKYCEFILTEDNYEDIIEKSKELKNNGHYVRLVKTDENIKTTKLEKEFVIIDKTEKDITNRNITSNMSLSDKCKKFLEIRDIDNIKHYKYLEVAREIYEEYNY